MKVEILTLHPEIYPGPLGISVLGRGLEQGLWSLNVTNIRDYATDKYGTVDGIPYGGGAGMILRPDVMDLALEGVFGPRDQAVGQKKILYLSPRGKPFSQQDAEKLAKESEIGLICGRFEGLDQRVIDYWQLEEVSIGDYVLAGGDVAAMSVVESTVRLLPGVLGSETSLTDESFQGSLLEYPLYTRPATWKDKSVPEVLQTGHHQKIDAWRRNQSEQITRERRLDLWEKYVKQGHED